MDIANWATCSKCKIGKQNHKTGECVACRTLECKHCKRSYLKRTKPSKRNSGSNLCFECDRTVHIRALYSDRKMYEPKTL